MDDTAGQVVPAEHIGLELLAQHRDRNILHRARLPISAIVEERIDAAAGAGCDLIHQGGNALRPGIVHDQRFDALTFQCRHILRSAHRGEDPPAITVKRAGAISTNAGGASGDDDDGLFRHGILDTSTSRQRSLRPVE